MPAPTVSFVPSSMRTNAPVTRLARVGLDGQRARDAQPHAADVVEREAVGRGRALGGREVEPVAHLVDDRAHGGGAVLQGEPRAGAQRRLREPADVGEQLARRDRRRLGGDEHVPAPEVEVAVDAHRHRLPGGRRLERRRRASRPRRRARAGPRAARRPRRPAAARRPRRGRRRRGRRRPGRAAPTGPGSAARPARRPAARASRGARAAAGPAYQPSRVRALDHVVAVQRAHRQRPDRAEPDPRREQVEVGHDAVEDLLATSRRDPSC